MDLFRSVAQKRNEHIVRKVDPLLDESEEVIDWVRARHPEDGRRGVAYITDRRFVVHWSGRKDGHSMCRWEEFATWGLNEDRAGGPILAIETGEGVSYVQLVVETKAMGDTLQVFMERFAELAPWPHTGPEAPEHDGDFEPRKEIKSEARHRTPAEMVKRVLITVAGIALIVVGILIIPLPGPWSFVLNIAGLALLAQEYDWAEDLLDWTKEKFAQAKKKMQGRKKNKS